MNARQPLTHEQAPDLAPLYVLGALEEAEMASVREHLATCPNPTLSSRSFGGVVPYLLDDPSIKLVEPPAALGDRILAAAAADLAARATVAVSEPRLTLSEPPRSRSKPRRRPSSSCRHRSARPGPIGPAFARALEWVLRIAAVVAIVALGAGVLRLKARLATWSARSPRRELPVRGLTVLAVAAQEGSQTAILAPVEPGGPRGLAAVAFRRLDPVRDGRPRANQRQPVYETWAIVGEEAPVPLGSFTVDATGVADFTSRQGPTGPRGRRRGVARTGGWRDDTDRCRLGRSRDEPRLGRFSRASSRASRDPRRGPAQRRLRRGDDRLAVGPVGREAGHARRHRDAPPADLGQLGDAVEDAPRDCRPGRTGATRMNSSPPRRATVSTSRTAPASTDATDRSTSSPASRPPAALVAAKSSTSKIATETSPPWRPARASSSSRTRANVRWLARPVSGSVWARRSNHSDRSAIVEARRDRVDRDRDHVGCRPQERGVAIRELRPAPRPANRTAPRLCSIPPRPTISG